MWLAHGLFAILPFHVFACISPPTSPAWFGQVIYGESGAFRESFKTRFLSFDAYLPSPRTADTSLVIYFPETWWHKGDSEAYAHIGNYFIGQGLATSIVNTRLVGPQWSDYGPALGGPFKGTNSPVDALPCQACAKEIACSQWPTSLPMPSLASVKASSTSSGRTQRPNGR